MSAVKIVDGSHLTVHHQVTPVAQPDTMMGRLRAKAWKPYSIRVKPYRCIESRIPSAVWFVGILTSMIAAICYLW